MHDVLPPGGDVSSFGWAPEWQDVVYIADQDFNDVSELYSVELSSLARIKLNNPLYPGGDHNIRTIGFDGGLGRPCLFLPGLDRVLYSDYHYDGWFGQTVVYSASRTGSPPVAMQSSRRKAADAPRAERCTLNAERLPSRLLSQPPPPRSRAAAASSDCPSPCGRRPWASRGSSGRGRAAGRS